MTCGSSSCTDERDYVPLIDEVIIIPDFGTVECAEYQVQGDNIRESDETFTITLTMENQNDVFSGDFLTVTIQDDGDSKWSTQAWRTPHIPLSLSCSKNVSKHLAPSNK